MDHKTQIWIRDFAFWTLDFSCELFSRMCDEIRGLWTIGGADFSIFRCNIARDWKNSAFENISFKTVLWKLVSGLLQLCLRFICLYEARFGIYS